MEESKELVRLAKRDLSQIVSCSELMKFEENPELYTPPKTLTYDPHAIETEYHISLTLDKNPKNLKYVKKIEDYHVWSYGEGTKQKKYLINNQILNN